MVETKRPFLYAVSHRLGPLSKLFHRDTSVTVTLVNKNFVETHGAYDREPFGKKTCTTEIQLRNLLCPELPNLSPGGRGRVSLFSPPVQTRLVLHGVLVMLSTLAISSHIPPFLGQVFL